MASISASSLSIKRRSRALDCTKFIVVIVTIAYLKHVPYVADKCARDRICRDPLSLLILDLHIGDKSSMGRNTQAGQCFGPRTH